MIFFSRDPVLVDSNQLPHAVQKDLFWYNGHIHPFRRAVKPTVVIRRPEDRGITLFILVGFDTLKNRLAIMKRRKRRLQQQGLVRFDLYILPFPILIIRFQHVIRKIFSKRNIFQVNVLQLASFRLCY
jgi:hypothetical protein